MQTRPPVLFPKTALTRQKSRHNLNPSSKPSPRRRNPPSRSLSPVRSPRREEALPVAVRVADVVVAAVAGVVASKPSLLPSHPLPSKASFPTFLLR